MTTIRTCSNLAEAQLLKALLDDAGLPAFLPDELTANSAPQLVFGSGIRVQVEDEDAEEARRVLDDAATDSVDPASPEKINLAEKFARFGEHWSPKIVAELNSQHVKLVKFRGEFVWHRHDNEDELFLVVRGNFRMEFRDRAVELREGEMIVVPRGLEHRPVADEEVSVLLFEPATTVNTGNNPGEKTVAAPEWI